MSNNPNHSVEEVAAQYAVDFSDNGAGLTSPTASASSNSTNADLGHLAGATLEDIEVGTEAIYLVDRRNKEAKTVLKSIRGKDVPSIQAKHLRNWCVSLGIQMKKSYNKLEVVRCILLSKTYHERGGNNDGDTPTAVVAPNAARIHINNVRFINVLAKEDIKAALLQRGTQKTRAQLDSGADPDGDLFNTIADTYNDSEDESLVDLKFNVQWTKAPEPNRFQAINAEKACQTFKDLSKKYEQCFSNWKKSGHHGDIPTKPFHDFVGSSNYLDYLHELLQETPGLMETFKGDLPVGVFSEGDRTNTRPRKRPKKSSDESMEKIATAQSRKADSLAYSTHAKQYATMELALDQKRKEKTRIIRELKSCDKFMGQSTTYLKAYIDKIKKQRANGNFEDDGSDSDESIPLGQLSQNSSDSFDDHRLLIDEYLELEQSMSEKKEQMKTLKTSIDTYLASLKANEAGESQN